jgi:hypothetical protein
LYLGYSCADLLLHRGKQLSSETEAPGKRLCTTECDDTHLVSAQQTIAADTPVLLSVSE